MTALYELTPELQDKYKQTLDFWEDVLFIRYFKRYFDLLSSGDYEEYAPLYSALELGVEERMAEALHYKPDTTLTLENYRKGHNITVNRQLYNMYINFLENVIIPEMGEPEEGSELIITTSNGGSHLAYYRNGQYEVPMSDKSTKIESGVVIHWRLYSDTLDTFTGR